MEVLFGVKVIGMNSDEVGGKGRRMGGIMGDRMD